MAKIKKKKLEIPDSVKELRYSYKKFAKKHGIRIKGKGMSKKERKRQKTGMKTSSSTRILL